MTHGFYARSRGRGTGFSLVWSLICLPLLLLAPGSEAAAQIPIPQGFPDASTTGIAGVGLTPGQLTPSGALAVTTPGAVIEGMAISGGVAIRANDVTIRRCLIRGGQYGIQATFGTTGTVIEDCTIQDGTGKGIYGRGMEVRRCNISNYEDGITLMSNSLVEDCWIHDLAISSSSHNDCIQSSSGSHIVIRHNSLQGPYRGQTSALIFQAVFGPVDDVLFQNNFLSGGTYTVYVEDKGYGYGNPTNVHLDSNVFEQGSGKYGHVQTTGPVTYTCNVWHTGVPIPQNPVCSQGPNRPPVASAGPDQKVIDADFDGSEIIQLDGRESYDPDGRIVSYAWMDGSSLLATGVAPQVVLPVGIHDLKLIVTDALGLRGEDTVRIEVEQLDLAVELEPGSGWVGAGDRLRVEIRHARGLRALRSVTLQLEIAGWELCLLPDALALFDYEMPGPRTGVAILRVPIANWVAAAGNRELRFHLEVSDGATTVVRERAYSSPPPRKPLLDGTAEWYPTAPHNSMAAAPPGLFTQDIGTQSLSTRSGETNIHDHVAEASSGTSWSNYLYTGRMRISSAGSGIGITFCSEYPRRDAYYRLRRYAGNSFHIAAHGTTTTWGTTDSGVVPVPGTWYRFSLVVLDEGSATRILAKIWPEATPEPATWQIDCIDSSSTRIPAGIVGVWAMGPGEKTWSDLEVRF